VRDIRTKNGKKYEGVKVDNRSKIARLDKPNGSAFANARATMQQSEGTSPPFKPDSEDRSEWRENAPQSRPRDQQGEDEVTETRKHLMRCCNLYNLCIATVDKAIAPNLPNIAQTQEQFQSTLASLWIEASSRRSNDGVNWWSWIDRMPDKPLPVNGGKHSATVKPIQKESNKAGLDVRHCACDNTEGDNPLCPIHST
jgi:hypothetical protein